VSPDESSLLILILIIGIVIVLALLIKAGLQRVGIPALVGYISLGILLHYCDQRFQLFSAGEREVLEFLADIGIISLLFRVGIESNLEDLIRQLRSASIVWFGDFFLSGLLGFTTAYYLLELDLISSFFIGTAMTATSVGVSASLWRDAQAIRSENGEMMLDIAEMDDISAVIAMALLFSIVPVLQTSPDAPLLPILVKTAGIFCLKAMIFGTVCFVFSRYAEEPITRFFQRIEAPPDPTIMVSGIGVITASIAGLLGFSVAIGAFFAGLVFSRDPDALKIDASFDAFYETFVPFFFIGIGLSVDLSVILTALRLGLILLVVAVLGKIIGVGAPVFLMNGWPSAVLLGVSMVPRAEIAMIVMQRGLQMGEGIISTHIFGSMVVVSMATTLVVPFILQSLLRRWPQFP
jgi:Kef-type K+ transport system membrane component KefB